MELNRGKTFIYIPPHLHTPENIQLCNKYNIPLSKLIDDKGVTTYGVKIAGIPIGDDDFIDYF